MGGPGSGRKGIAAHRASKRRRSPGGGRPNKEKMARIKKALEKMFSRNKKNKK